MGHDYPLGTIGNRRQSNQSCHELAAGKLRPCMAGAHINHGLSIPLKRSAAICMVALPLIYLYHTVFDKRRAPPLFIHRFFPSPFVAGAYQPCGHQRNWTSEKGWNH
eukprot:TRINITY_DN35516_c0_g1_i1.p2 TRINITY_DN35516_c0_g1~~TRINITY_DN35516_c0_g1_i1.p2  ORF type:complete len:107 (+),score=28.33 TRINITY_DN35516_c0_g1_i1:67-387(+)